MTPIDDTEAIGRAYRTGSTELPPPETDAALRAAARRAVLSRPKRERHMRNWPLAAAAVVAMLAVGILQMTPPEEVTPGEVATSAPPAGGGMTAMREAATSLAHAPAAANKEAGNAAPATPPPAAAQPQPTSSTAGIQPAASARNGANTYSLDTATSAKLKQEAQQAAAPARPAAALALPPPAPAPPTPAPDSAATARTQSPAQAFPAEPARQDAKREKRDTTVVDENRARTSAQLANAPSATPASAPAPASPSPAPSPPSEAAIANTTGDVAAKPAATMPGARKSLADAASPAIGAAAPAAAGAVAKDVAIKPPEEWIKLIRQLRSEGKIDASNRELAAFRTAYGDRADALLPADLRAIKP
jgi:hypothetical protein